MKFKGFSTALMAISVIAVGGLQPAYADTPQQPSSQRFSVVRFQCGSTNPTNPEEIVSDDNGQVGVPTTIADTVWGSIPIIRWTTDQFGSNWMPLARCGQVAARFQRFYECGLLVPRSRLFAGEFFSQPLSNNERARYPVIFARVSSTDDLSLCNLQQQDFVYGDDRVLLLTLQGGENPDNPQRVIDRLNEIRDGAEVPVCDVPNTTSICDFSNP